MRYFSATVENGRIYLHYITGAGLSYRTAEEVERVFNDMRDRRIHSVEELDQTVHESEGRSLPLGMIYVAEGLEEEAKRRGPHGSPPIRRS